MKIFKLLLIGFLSTSYQQSPTSSNQPEVDEFTLLRISNAISAHVRLINAFERYSVLMQPGNMDETVQEAVRMFFFVNETYANALLKIDASYARRIVDELRKISTKGVALDNAMIAVDQLLDIYNQLHDLPPLAEKNKSFRLPSIVENPMELNVKQLEDYKNKVGDMKDTQWLPPATPPPDDGLPDKPIPSLAGPNDPASRPNSETDRTTEALKAANAIEEFHVETEKIVDQIKRSRRIQDVLDVIDPIKRRIDILSKKEQISIDDLKKMNRLVKIMKQMPSFDTASRVSEALLQLIVENGNSDFVDWNLLKKDLNDVDFGFWLNDAGNTTKLKSILEPFWTPAEKISKLAQDVKDIARQQGTMGNIKMIHNLMLSASQLGQSADEFDSSLITLCRVLNDSNSAPQEVSDGYNNITSALDQYLELQKEFDEFLTSENYTLLKQDAEYGRTVRSSVSRDKYESVRKNDKFKEIFNRFDGVYSRLEKFKTETQNIGKRLSSLTLADLTAKAEKWIRTTFKDTVQELEKYQKNVLRAKSGLEFVKLHQSTSSLGSFSLDVKKIQEAIQIFKEGIITTNGELEHLPDEANNEKAYYQYMIYLKDHYHPKDKMASGAILFELFHRFINGSAFDEMLKAGEELGKKIQEFPVSNETRYDLVVKMKKFDTIKDRITELKHQVLLRKGRYDGVPMDELIDLRWLIENLHDLPNPEFIKQEWMDFAEKVGTVEAADFNKTLVNTFDLDFAAHQKQVIDTYKNYRALVRYNKAVLNIEKYLVATILFNLGLYGTAILKMKKDVKRELAEEREMEYMYQKFLMNMANGEQTDYEDDDKD
ncbi:hypothetical protein CAEBREN_22617 [Caenorhabditis brenneri]|uniref:Domain of unknown function WSN domain-containing protein n=1 Tax=Caenorhabditis brenneri TaxID=135651 RepID=G0N5S4_CAEBE|nr:hypothetical protein CAEBREN_22617 [Caenorhabditis brenneri]